MFCTNKPLESILRKKIYLSNIEHDVTVSKIPFSSLLPLECRSRYFFMYARSLPVQTIVHFKNLQFRTEAFDIGFLSRAFDSVFSLLK